MEGKPLDVGLLREALPDILPLRGESVWDRWTKALGGDRTNEELPEVLGKLRHHQTLDYVLMLLRYHRPGFDDTPRDERSALLADSCAYLNDALEGMKKFMAYVEYGVPGRGAVPVAKSIARDVKAAVLKDVDGLTYHEIGKRLGVPPPPTSPIRATIQPSASRSGVAGGRSRSAWARRAGSCTSKP